MFVASLARVLRLSEFDVTDAGVGINAAWRAAPIGRVRLEIGDLMVRYGNEAHRSNGELSEGFISHNKQVSTGVMWRF
jgi:hypothetical protein